MVDKLNTEVPISESPESTKGSQSQSLCQDSDALLSSDLDQLVHNNKEVRIRSKSSTRLDFLSFEDPFLTVSSSVRTDSSDMSNGGGNKVLANDLCKCASGLTPQDCCDKGDEEATSGILLETLRQAVNKIDALSGRMSGLEKQIKEQDTIIEGLVKSSNSGSSSKEGHSATSGTSKSKKKVGATSGTSKSLEKVGGSKSSKAKSDRVQEEKLRQLKILQEKLKGNNSGNRNIPHDSGSSEDEIDIKRIKKKMLKKQRDQCSRTVSARLKQIGGIFPEDDFTTSSSSGTDTSGVRRKCSHSSRQIKSGAKVRKRPVVKTELWPHTIANEEDGEEVSCDSISLAKFFSCFTFIMLECGRVESKGRTGLLHAVSLVLESLYWQDARTFHNLVMVKLEQGRCDWATNFTELAEEYIDKKIRQNFKAKSGSGSSKAGSYYRKSSGNSYNNSYSNYNKNGGRGFNRNYSGKSKMLHNSICKQWNSGTCSYGDKCNRWHVCWTCAEAGKVGEMHKSSSHGNPVARSNT